jgi:hypothetical protein
VNQIPNLTCTPALPWFDRPVNLSSQLALNKVFNLKLASTLRCGIMSSVPEDQAKVLTLQRQVSMLADETAKVNAAPPQTYPAFTYLL